MPFILYERKILSSGEKMYSDAKKILKKQLNYKWTWTIYNSFSKSGYFVIY